ncbi:helix-turn-helix domain-containing protein [Actinoallomurus purpureus]|uniref:helix-turn-helix domain-containing protein n=1 Tax=Actinoallomurus purpureus TaxID=478114 RepID=UPI0020925996|nr:helix-turn-helix transcriptional regulator [Actinoallomurus purpureus]MCO6009935.1 helix-turn-helix domain-containing protein [Actinoallomurus purpureus]
MPGQESLGERVRNFRLRKQLSQAQLAWPELSDSYVSLIESGKRTPAPSMVALLARKLGCSESYLLTGVTEETISGLRETLGYAQIALQNGAASEARIRFAEVLADPALTDLPALAHEARWGHALALEATGALEEAISDLELATQTLSPLSEPERWAEVHTALSRCHRERGDLARSIQVGEDALEQLTAAGGQWTDTMVMLGSTILAAYEQRGDLAYARQLATMLIERAEAIGSPRALMAAYWNAAWVADLRSDAREALKLSERAIALLGEEDDSRNLPRLRMAYAHFLLRAQPEQAEHARELLDQAEREMDSSAASTVDIAWCLMYQAQAEITLGRPVEAASLARRATEMLADTAGMAIAEAYTVLGDAQVRLGLREEAVAAFSQAVEYLEKMEAHRPAARAWFDLAELLGAAGQADGQKAAFQRALACMGL